MHLGMDRLLSERPAACEAESNAADQATLSGSVLGPTLGVTAWDRTWKHFFFKCDGLLITLSRILMTPWQSGLHLYHFKYYTFRH